MENNDTIYILTHLSAYTTDYMNIPKVNIDTRAFHSKKDAEKELRKLYETDCEYCDMSPAPYIKTNYSISDEGCEVDNNTLYEAWIEKQNVK